MTGKLSKVQKLAIAGAVAPELRGERPKRKGRIVVVDHSTGAEVGTLESVFDVVEGAAKRAGIELSIFPPDPRDQKVCAGWAGPCPTGAKPGRGAFAADNITRRGGGPWRCLTCGTRKGQAERPPEQRSAAARKGRASLTPEQRSEIARKGQAALTPEQRSEIARKRNAALTPEQRSEIARKGQAERPPEQRSEIARKGQAALTPEQRSEIARKRQAALKAKRNGKESER